MISKIIVKILKWKKLKGEAKTRIITALLENIDALPIRDAITFDQDGTIIIRGKKIDIETAQLLKQSATALKDNYTRKIIQEQMLYTANKIGLHQGLTPEQIQFSKALVWVIQNEQQLLDKLEEN
jgi:uncharacterized protein YgbK (DUF1537 family)